MLALLAACREPAPGTAPDDSGTPPPAEAPFTAVGFNTESDGSDPERVALDTIAPVAGESLWGLCEVEYDDDAQLYVAAAMDEGSAQRWDHVLGTTGWSDLLMLAWDDAVFALEGYEELDDINVGGTVRAPLVGTMRHRASDVTFLFVVNHLWRSDTANRHEQAELLNAWGREQTLPVLMVGDYNFDWDVESGDHDEGYDLLTDGGVFRWVEPESLVKTQCSSYYDSVLDFAFVGGAAKDWPATSEILWRDEDYCGARNEDTWSDHRPVAVTLTPSG